MIIRIFNVTPYLDKLQLMRCIFQAGHWGQMLNRYDWRTAT